MFLCAGVAKTNVEKYGDLVLTDEKLLITIPGVRDLQELAGNLINTVQLARNGFFVVHDGTNLWLVDKNKKAHLIAKVDSDGGTLLEGTSTLEPRPSGR